MNEDAQAIFDFLPIRRNPAEEEYISHLWSSFLALDSDENGARPFSIMPFHLLFMLSLQYKFLRISKEMSKEYKIAFMVNGGRDREIFLDLKSVFEIAALKERTIPEIFRLIGVEEDTIKEVKSLVDNRNDNLAHAKGGIDPDPDAKIQDYISILEILQNKFQGLNNKVARNWEGEIEAKGSLISEFVENRLLESYLCTADFSKGKLKKLAILKDLEIHVVN